MSGHGAAHVDPAHKKIALLIAVLALVLAISETLAKSAQTSALSYNIEASNLWAFFQAKTIRMTQLRTAAEAAEIDLQPPHPFTHSARRLFRRGSHRVRRDNRRLNRNTRSTTT